MKHAFFSKEASVTLIGEVNKKIICVRDNENSHAVRKGSFTCPESAAGARKSIGLLSFEETNFDYYVILIRHHY
jgi:hypothetical protein